MRIHSPFYGYFFVVFSWQVTSTIEAKCTTNGSQTSTCKVCGKSKTETLQMLGHDTYTASTTAASCTSQGSVTTKCRRTGCSYSSTTSTPSLGHNYKSDSKAATCTSSGYTQEKCSRCGATRNYSSTPSLRS